MVHDHAARWEELGLRDEPFDSGVRWKRRQLGRVLIMSDGHHHVDRLIGKRSEREPEQIDVGVEQRPEGHIDHWPRGGLPRSDGQWHRAEVQRLAGRHLCRLEHRRADLDGEVLVHPGPPGHVTPVQPPDRRHGVVRVLDGFMRRQGSEHVSDAGNTEKLGDQRAGERKGFEQHEVGHERLSVTQDVIDHLVDTHLGEGPREEVVQDALGRESVARVAARTRGESLHPVGLAPSGQREPRTGLLDDGRCLRPRRNHHVIATRQQRPDDWYERSHVTGSWCRHHEDFHDENLPFPTASPS